MSKSVTMMIQSNSKAMVMKVWSNLSFHDLEHALARAREEASMLAIGEQFILVVKGEG